MSRAIIAAFIALAVLVSGGVRTVSAEELPICSNRIINEVTQRVGCTVGDSKCWLTKGGFCTDYVQKMLHLDPSDRKVVWTPVPPGDVSTGDIAVFINRSHYAYVESVVRDKKGNPVAVNVSEYNFGTCLVDEQTMVTDKYRTVNKRSGISVIAVDGGFIRGSR